MERLNAMFDPRTVALVGASERAGSAGRTLLENLLKSGKQNVYAVNPNLTSALGLTCYPSVDALPQTPDLAVVAVRAELVPAVVAACGEAGVRSAAVVSTGFGDSHEGGRRLEEQLLDAIRRFGMRLLGPGSLGIIRTSVGLNASLIKVDPERGSIAFISQNGELGDAVLEWAREERVGFSLFASLGRTLDVDFGDLIDFLGEDYETRSILLDIAQIVHARKFMSAARGFARAKPIIALKPGRYEKAGDRTDSPMHTDDVVYDAAFRRVGLLRVKEAADLFDAARVLDAARLPAGRRLAIITNAVSVALMARDTLIEQGGEGAQLSDACVTEIDASVPRWSRENPVCLPIDAGVESYRAALRCCLKDEGIDALFVAHLPRAEVSPRQLADVIISTVKGVQKPVLAAMIGGRSSREGADLLIASNIPTYGTVEEAVRTYLNMYRYRRNLELLYETPEELPVSSASSRYRLKMAMQTGAHSEERVLSAEQAFELLQAYGVPVMPSCTVANEEEALARAAEIGYPLVLKVSGSAVDRSRTTRSAGVASEEGLRAALYAFSKAASEGPGEKRFRMTLQKMLWNVEYQLLLLSERHKEFGAVMLFGTAGMGYDLFRDYSIALPPLNQTLARRLIEETKAFELLQGYRGRKAADMRELEKIIVSISNLIVDVPEITSLAIDPLVVADGTFTVVGAEITLGALQSRPGALYPHLVITPYPSRYTTDWLMKDGTRVTLRPIRPEDEPLEQEMLTTISPTTLKQRFFSPIKAWTHDTLVRLCNIDYEREVALVAVLPEQNRIIAIGRLIIQPDLSSGEFAILVHDKFQKQGLGHKLVSLLIGIGMEKGLDQIEGIVLSDNDKMIDLAKSLGFKRKMLPDGISRIVLPLNEDVLRRP